MMTFRTAAMFIRRWWVPVNYVFLALALVSFLRCETTVYVTAHGKTYHMSQSCGMLKRAREIYAGDEQKAIAAGLKAHKNCGAKSSISNAVWAHPVGKDVAKMLDSGKAAKK